MPSSSGELTGVKGWLLRHASICVRTVVNSPKVSFTGETTRSPSPPFEKSGVDYAGPFQIKYGHLTKPTIAKTYICVFVCLSVKSVHSDLVSDLTTEAFIAALRCFVARGGYPTLIWSHHGPNFVGAKDE